MKAIPLFMATALAAYGFIYLPAIPVAERRNNGVLDVQWYPVREFPKVKKRTKR